MRAQVSVTNNDVMAGSYNDSPPLTPPSPPLNPFVCPGTNQSTNGIVSLSFSLFRCVYNSTFKTNYLEYLEYIVSCAVIIILLIGFPLTGLYYVFLVFLVNTLVHMKPFFDYVCFCRWCLGGTCFHSTLKRKSIHSQFLKTQAMKI